MHDIHDCLAQDKCNRRAQALAVKYAPPPERFPNGVPTPPPLPNPAWINRPVSATCSVISNDVPGAREQFRSRADSRHSTK